MGGGERNKIWSFRALRSWRWLPTAARLRPGRKLANLRYWRNLGQSSLAAWGECQGSALYQVRVELTAFAVKCTCPSHKFPCKHGYCSLAFSGGQSAMSRAQTPLIGSRTGSPNAPQPACNINTKTSHWRSRPQTLTAERNKRIQKREALILQGLDTLDLWMSDLIRNGLASVQTQPMTFFDAQAAQLVDAQATRHRRTSSPAVRYHRSSGRTGPRGSWGNSVASRCLPRPIVKATRWILSSIRMCASWLAGISQKKSSWRRVRRSPTTGI